MGHEQAGVDLGAAERPEALVRGEPRDRVEPREGLVEQEQKRFGRHLAGTCVGCHKQDYTGGDIGGDPNWAPAANLGTILLSRIIRPLVPAGVLGRDLLDVFALFNAAIAAAALLPTPTFDGGALLKWSVYTQTGDLQQASSVVRRAGWSVSLVLTVCSAGLLVLRRWLDESGYQTRQLVSSLYDSFILEEDGSLASRIINEYSGLNLSLPPRHQWKCRK